MEEVGAFGVVELEGAGDGFDTRPPHHSAAAVSAASARTVRAGFATARWHCVGYAARKRPGATSATRPSRSSRSR